MGEIMEIVFAIFISLNTLYASSSHEIPFCLGLCPPCLPEKMSKCPAIPLGCKITVDESGCGCCRTCAASLGEKCGIGRAPCAPGLICQGSKNQTLLAAILSNDSTCQPAETTRKNLLRRTGIINFSHQGVSSRRSRNRSRHPRHPHNNGPCTERLENMLTSCIFLPEQVWVPSCQKNGFYKPLQCTTRNANGNVKCWCVNRRGKKQGKRIYSNRNVKCS